VRVGIGVTVSTVRVEVGSAVWVGVTLLVAFPPVQPRKIVERKTINK
jgi:hypothetical protein